MVEFIIQALFSRRFWMLVLSSFTLVLMLGWRSKLKDEIYWEAAKSVGRTKKW